MDFASITKKGEKDYISDSVKISEAGHCTCFAVSDGRETPKAAELVTNSIIEDFDASGMITKSSVPDFMKKAHEILLAEDVPAKASASILLTDGNAAVWDSIGDCRIYHLRENFLYDITPDDTEAYDLYDNGEFRYPKIRKNAKRHKLLRQLGDNIESEKSFLQPRKLRAGDSMLICTDGFWSSIHERQIERTLKKSSSAQEWLDLMVAIVQKNIKIKKYSRFKDSYSAITLKL